MYWASAYKTHIPGKQQDYLPVIILNEIKDEN